MAGVTGLLQHAINQALQLENSLHRVLLLERLLQSREDDL
jgi:hypothetical protein